MPDTSPRNTGTAAGAGEVGIDESMSGGGLSDPDPGAGAARSAAGVCEHAAITTKSATIMETTRVMDFILPP
jgi:hypothetical protein